jgi:Caspase domain/Domain of unknown function (DUF4189)
LRFAPLIGLMVGTLLAVQMPARADTRVALVIGNGTYQNVSALPNPVNDANDISDSLRRLGFDVKTLTNANFDDMRRALIGFGQKARGAEFAVIFFAGHGMEIGGENWLIPVDAQLGTDLDVPNETIGLQFLTRAVSNTTKLGLVILDACRNNPFLPKMQRTNMTRAVDRGFARVEPNDNVLVAYSARDGTTANDGSGRNSPFTSSLLRNIETPGLEVTFLFRTVRDDVMAATDREQQPFIYGSLSRDFVYLKSANPNTPQEANSTTGPADNQQYPRGRPEFEVPLATAPSVGLCSSAETHWRSAEAIGTKAAFEDHLARYPNCAFSGLAKAKIASLNLVVAPPQALEDLNKSHVPPLSPKPEVWLDIAVGVDLGRIARIGASASDFLPSASQATQSALKECHSLGLKNCKSLGPVNSGCLYATTGTKGTRVGWGSGPSNDTAVEQCKSKGVSCDSVAVGGCVEDSQYVHWIDRLDKK